MRDAASIRLRELAEAALPAYGMAGARLRPLRGLALRGVFRVDVSSAPALQSAGLAPQSALGEHAMPAAPAPGIATRFVLRIHGYEEDRLQLRSVLDWLVALRRDADLGVPEPVPARDGALLVETTVADGEPSPRSCELLRWLDGRVPGGTFSYRMLERLGAFTARLHDHAVRFVSPPGFSRPRGEADAILRGDKRIVRRLREMEVGPLGNGGLTMLEEAEARLREEYRQLPRDGSSHGLMHGDLHPRNLLFFRGDIRAIDFEGCGFDFFLYDLAGSLVEGAAGWEILAQQVPAFALRRDALLRGYRSVRPLRQEEVAHLSTFMAVRSLSSLPWLVDWAATRSDDGWTRMVLDARLRFLRAYLEGQCAAMPSG